MRTLAKWAALVAFLVGCGAAEEPASVVAAQEPVEDVAPDEPAELEITVVAEGGGFGGFEPPPWEQFAIELAPVTIREQVTAVGEGMADGATPLGGSCEQLLADFPELTGCTEHTDRYAEAGTYAALDETLSVDGELTIAPPEAGARLVVFATDPTDEYCDWYGSADIEPNQRTATLEVALSCA